jgi:adenylate kinase
MTMPLSTRIFQLTKNLTFIGPPGSGKGYYGKPLAAFWGIPLLSASSILRQSTTAFDLDSGKLVDCETVSDTLLNYLSTRFPEDGDSGTPSNFILDGFPRTLQQIEHMNTSWPAYLRVHVAVYLDIPDIVCEQKMLGRRNCVTCGKDYNIANVQIDNFDLPPSLTQHGCQVPNCNPDTDWTRRPDDTPTIVRERLRVHRHHEQPILDYYKGQGRLLSLTPYKGAKDMPRIKTSLEEWLTDLK